MTLEGGSIESSEWKPLKKTWAFGSTERRGFLLSFIASTNLNTERRENTAIKTFPNHNTTHPCQNLSLLTREIMVGDVLVVLLMFTLIKQRWQHSCPASQPLHTP